MVQCAKCEFRTKYPGGKMCWELERPLCGDCAYELDQKLHMKLEKLKNNPLIKRFLEEEVIPVLLKYKQNPNFELYKKTYIRKPSTKGGRFSSKNSSKGVITQCVEAS